MHDRQTKAGLVDLYDFWPGNGAGLFLQLQSLHGASGSKAIQPKLLGCTPVKVVPQWVHPSP